MDEMRDADVVVIGAGPGGLSAAAYLATSGRRVVVVEARDVPGGHMSAFTHHGYEFDIGLHFTAEESARAVLRPVGADVTFRDQGDDLTTLFLPDRRMTVPRGRAQVRDWLHREFPGEQPTTDTFLSTVDALTEEMAQLPARPRLRDVPGLTWGSRHVLRHARSTLGGYLDSLRPSRQLRTVLSALAPEGALPPSRLSLLAYAQMAGMNMDGMAYPEGGSTVISDRLASVVREHGGELRFGVEVDQILVQHGRARGVRVRPASWDQAPEPSFDIHAKAVISAVDVKRTYLRLLDPSVLPDRVVRRIRALETALPFFVLYLVLDRDLAAEGYPTTNTGIFGSDDVEAMYAGLAGGRLGPDSSAYLWIANLADPGNPRLCRSGQTNLQVITVAPAAHDFWGAAPGLPTGARYTARKRELRDRLIGLADRAVPGIESSIAFEEAATPITEERLMRCTGGSSYGPAFIPGQTVNRPGFVGPVDRLYLAGASTRTGAGLIGTLHSGVSAASAVTGVPVGELLGSSPPGRRAGRRTPESV